MAKSHIVTCYGCGRQFNVNKTGGAYHKIKHKYYCPSCYREQKRLLKKAKVEERLQRTGMKQSFLAMIVKILLGISLVFGAFSGSATNDAKTVIISIIVGILLILWGLIPFLRRKR